MIFFSAHGVPLTYVEDAGDPYRDQMEDCIALIMGELRTRGILNSHTLAYQVYGILNFDRYLCH
jgi:protoporphyrin/coproporphyrin ferrochelatase